MKYIHEFVNLKNAYYLCLNWGKINGFGNQRCKVWQYILKEIELKVGWLFLGELKGQTKRDKETYGGSV